MLLRIPSFRLCHCYVSLLLHNVCEIQASQDSNFLPTSSTRKVIILFSAAYHHEYSQVLHQIGPSCQNYSRRTYHIPKDETDSVGAVIQKESAAIRTSFREEPSGNVRQQNVLKLLYLTAAVATYSVGICLLLAKEHILVKLSASNCSLLHDSQINVLDT